MRDRAVLLPAVQLVLGLCLVLAPFALWHHAHTWRWVDVVAGLGVLASAAALLPARPWRRLRQAQAAA